jgi:hypothetical protein
MIHKRTGRAAVVVLVLSVLAGCPARPAPGTDATSPPASAGPAATTPAANVAAAAAYAASHDVRTGIAVLDLRTGEFYGAGDHSGRFGAASVMKVLIAVRLLATGQMTGNTATLATAMIERSDDDAVAQLWPLVGGPEIIDWVQSHYALPFLGAANTEPGIWGSTQITARGMVYLYRAIAADPLVRPWLLDAMRHTTNTAADGTDQFFGIPAATTGFAVKQGWGTRSSSKTSNVIINTTGFVNDDRFAVAILNEGMGYRDSTDRNGFSAALAAIVTEQARIILPGGRIQ